MVKLFLYLGSSSNQFINTQGPCRLSFCLPRSQVCHLAYALEYGIVASRELAYINRPALK